VEVVDAILADDFIEALERFAAGFLVGGASLTTGISVSSVRFTALPRRHDKT
jgi:hypothetical protein